MIRPAAARDVDDLLQLIRDLAEFERSADAVETSADDLRRALFDDHPAVFAHVAEQDGRVEGMAIWFRSFSTWTGTHGIYLEDLYVRPGARARGVGRALVASLAAEARRSGYARVEWAVLDWNEQALRFYRSLGATPQDEWTTYRLAGDALAALSRTEDQA